MTEKEFVLKVKESYGGNSKDILLALDFAKQIYKNEKRLNGDDYITHPIAVAGMLIEYGLDYETIIAALMHDSVKMGLTTFKKIKDLFGENVEALVKGYVKISSLQYERADSEHNDLENVRQMFLALGKDLRVILIRICDRYHNLQTLENLSQEKQFDLASETMDIFVPLVERLGMGKLRSSMEDICFKYLNPQAYFKIDEELKRKYDKKTTIMNEISGVLESALKKLNIKGEVSCRFKHYYSIYKKLKKSGIEKIYDIIAHRVIVPEIKDCYAVLGEIHSHFRPVPGRIKDYIASPKPNGYQSLHTTLLTKDGVPFEVQIRTFEMHKFCEYGVAAHWRYKEGNVKNSLVEEKINWLKKTIESEKQIKDNESFINALKMDLSTGVIWVFTPKYKPIELPENATPVDFAYAIHSGVGDKCVGAKVNDKMVPLNYQLETGDVVEILTNQNSKGPSLDWLNFARSSSTRNHIRQYFKKQSKEENIKLGKDILELEAKKCGYQLSDLLSDLDIADLTKRFNLTNIDDVFASIGYGGITAKQAIGKVVAQRKQQEKLARKAELQSQEQIKHNDDISAVVVDGLSGLTVRFGGCCHPIAGDEIVGFASRNRGITIHRKDCPNVKNISKDKEVKVEWKHGKGQVFNTTLTLITKNSSGVLSKITTLLANMKINIASVSTKMISSGEAVVNLVIQVQSRDQAKEATIKLRQLDGIYDVR